MKALAKSDHTNLRMNEKGVRAAVFGVMF